MSSLLFPLAILLGAATGLLRGRRWRPDSRHRFRGPWLAPLALLLQVALFSRLSPLPERLGGSTNWMYALSTLLALVFLALNWRFAGFPLLIAGSLLNLIVILANDGYMPASTEATALAGHPARAERLRSAGRAGNVRLLDGATRLPFLGDVIPLPAPPPFADAYSAGDLLLFGGGLYFGYGLLGTPKPAAPRPRHVPDGQANA